MRFVSRERFVACERQDFAQLRNLASHLSLIAPQQLPLPITGLAETRWMDKFQLKGRHRILVKFLLL
jgi:hypothetical protein